MNIARRILIVDSSRWESYKLRSQLVENNSIANITLMTTAEAGLEEMSRANYDFAIFELSDILAYEINSRKFITDFLEITNSSYLIIIDGTNDEALSEQFSNRLFLHLDSEKASIIKRDNRTHLVIPKLIEQLDSLSTSISKTFEELTSGLGLEDFIHPTNIQGKLSHEINNPLMAISGTVELLLNNPEYCQGELGRKLRIIQRSARRIRSSMEKMNENMSQTNSTQRLNSRLPSNRVLTKI